MWDQPLLAFDRVRYFGEPVAAIAADSLEIAGSAARLISIEYEHFHDHRSRGCHATRRAARARSLGSLPGGKIARQRWQRVLPFQPAQGDIVQGFAEADYLFEDSFTTESVHQSHVERVAIGSIAPDGRVTVHSNTQLPYWIRTNVAHALGVEEEAVRIVPTGIGGVWFKALSPARTHRGVIGPSDRPACANRDPVEEEITAGPRAIPARFPPRPA